MNFQDSSQRHQLSRRTLLRTGGYAGAAALTATLLPRSVQALASGAFDPQGSWDASARWRETAIDDPAIKALALRAIDAAKSAGAIYADVRLTRTEHQGLFYRSPADAIDQDAWAIGVRALVNGYWGFAASPLWTDEDAVRLAREAVAQATANARGPAQTVELGTAPVASGSWTMPVKRDPFTVPLEERMDFLASYVALLRDSHPRVFSILSVANFVRQGRAVATSDGACFTQTVYESIGEFTLALRHPDASKGQKMVRVEAKGLGFAGKGWELFTEADPHGQIPAMIEEAEELLHAPEKPVELGRFDTVFPAAVVAPLVDQTLGMPTELDRALGYEANASGTSYVNQPLRMLGSYKMGNRMVTLTGTRRAAGGLATVKWDDEGVAPADVTLVREGVLQDFQTTREQAAWLAPWYETQQKSAQSHGCAGAASALDVTMQRPPNFVLEPGAESASEQELVANIKKGVMVCRGGVSTDHQGRTGSGSGELILREIVDGKLGSILVGANFLFNASQLWNDIIAIGGKNSVEWHGVSRRKGQPEQMTRHSVSAVPIVVKDVAVFDRMRKA